MPKLLTKLRNLPLTIVLTILIWMYAEAQNVTSKDNLPITIRVTPFANDEVLRLVDPMDGKFRISVGGKQASVDRVANGRQEELASMDFTPAHRLPLGQKVTVDSVAVLNALPYFQRNGLTVTSASPAQIRLDVEPQVLVRKAIIFRGNLPVKITPDHADVLMPQSVRDSVGEGHINVYARPLRELDTLPRQVEQTIAAQLIVEGPAPTDDRVVVSPQQVTLTLTIPQQREQSVEVPEVPVRIAAPPELLARYTIEIRPKSVRVTVAGPDKLLERIRTALAQGGQDTDTKIRAYVDLEPGDKPSDAFTSRPLRYVYPPGLELRQTPDHVEFRLVAPAPPDTAPASTDKS